ncbi:hypothetical protein DOY81_012768 [Sarcophaga bullata]|nr:hypothetical protein DOY81_012768 [Sarcophaga bullata]
MAYHQAYMVCIYTKQETYPPVVPVGNHYNPRDHHTAARMTILNNRHAGDLGNIRADDSGRATFRFMDNVLEVGNK